MSLALMQGIEHLPAKSLELSRVPVSTAVQRLAAAGDCAVQITPHYYFLYPPGYEFLQEISLADKLDPAYHDVEGRMAFGAGTSLFNVFAWLSQGMGITVVADNAIASALCGELSLGTAPLAHGLEAVLKSARVIAFDVDSTEEFVFIYAAGRTPPRDFLLNPGPLDPDYDAILSRRISSLYLPEPPSDPTRMQYHPGATPLEEVLESLSRQLGIRVVAERQLEQLPVNPCVMHDVTVRTALNLLVRQWLAPGFGYQLSRDRIVIRAR